MFKEFWEQQRRWLYYVEFNNGEVKEYCNYEEIFEDIKPTKTNGNLYTSTDCLKRWRRECESGKTPKGMIRNGIVKIEYKQEKLIEETVVIKEIKREDLGLPCGGNYSLCNCGCSDMGIVCNGNIYNVTYLIDGELIKVKERAEFSRVLKEEIKVKTYNKEGLINRLKENEELRYIIQGVNNYEEVIKSFSERCSV